MSYVMQNVYFGIKLPISLEIVGSFEAQELIINHSLTHGYYNGRISSGTSGHFFGIQLFMLQDEEVFDLTNFISKFNEIGYKKTFDKKLAEFLNDEMWKGKEFEGANLTELFEALKIKPQLWIIPETD